LNLHRFAYDVAVKKYTLVARGPPGVRGPWARAHRAHWIRGPCTQNAVFVYWPIRPVQKGKLMIKLPLCTTLAFRQPASDVSYKPGNRQLLLSAMLTLRFPKGEHVMIISRNKMFLLNFSHQNRKKNECPNNLLTACA